MRSSPAQRQLNQQAWPGNMTECHLQTPRAGQQTESSPPAKRPFVCGPWLCQRTLPRAHRQRLFAR
eukprot:6040528-Lingulodinium_polyedra.AAC.1